MFVAINNVDKSAIYLDGEIKKARNAGEITPEFAMDILAKTNHRSNVKKLVGSIKDICKTKEELLPYREFILSCVDGRDVSGEALLVLQEMADLCECREEFDVANKEAKLYKEIDVEGVTVSNGEDFYNLAGKNLTVYYDGPDLLQMNFTKVKKIRFRDGYELNLHGAYRMPKDVDLSKNPVVNLTWAELDGVKFMDGAKVDLRYAKLPKDLDVSMCDEVNLEGCDLDKLTNLKFKDGAVVDMHGVGVLPDYLDVSTCLDINLASNDFVNVKELKFRKGARVNLKGAKNLPEELDLSRCSRVDLICCDLMGVRELKFRDKEQEKMFMADVTGFKGKVVYSVLDLDTKMNSIFNKGMEG